jgi:hypothetical protein
MVETLAQPLCRTVFCEVHFRLLAEAGQHQAVRQIRNLLREAGFVRIRWVARSHLLASKS